MNKRRYKKKGCSLCKIKPKISWFFPTSKNEEKDIFYSYKCSKCKDVKIIYKWHNVPNDKELKHMIDWASKTFKFRVPDFKCEEDHFYFHMRRGKGKVDLKKRITYFKCDGCGNFFINQVTFLDNGIFCKNCCRQAEGLEELSGEFKGVEDLEFSQLDDYDYEAREGIE